MTEDKNIVEAFINLTKKLRKEQKLTIEQLADLAKVHRTTIGLLERYERTPSLQIAQQIAMALGFSVSELLQEAELINRGKVTVDEIVASHVHRKAKSQHLRNEQKLIDIIGIDGQSLLLAIDSCYQTLDTIDEQLRNNGSVPIAHLVELANLSSMVGNIIGGGLADCSNGIYERNKPHTYPDLIPLKNSGVDLELKMALETNKPKGHLPKPGTYITFRYILGDKTGIFHRGKKNRGDTVWIWEIKVGALEKDNFSCSNTEGDSGKTAVIRTDVFNKMHLVYYVPNFLPYAPKKDNTYVGYN
ncbi:helix-turn-helix transcriptional regulator [Desulfobacterales bacterium HSG17]|nr:helix-turn-helix transcriptional regulator [Desulfobacterales bacterium HSG17]